MGRLDTKSLDDGTKLDVRRAASEGFGPEPIDESEEELAERYTWLSSRAPSGEEPRAERESLKTVRSPPSRKPDECIYVDKSHVQKRAGGRHTLRALNNSPRYIDFMTSDETRTLRKQNSELLRALT